MKPSAAASSPLHHHPSQIRAMPSPPASRYSVLNGIPPVTIIDETTSDVPLSGNLIRGTFTPKIEDTCTDSGMYTMDSLLSRRSPIMAERSPIITEQTSLLPEESTSTMTEQSRSMMGDQSATIITEQSRSMLQDQSASILAEQSRSMMHDQSASLISEQTRSMLRDQSSSILNESPRSMLRDQSVQLISERSATILPEQTTSMLPGEVPVVPIRITSVRSHAANVQPSTSTQNKLYPNSFDMSSKSFAGNGPWLLNQDGDNLDNWLGDVFIGDNLTPGLSLPQRNAVYLKTE